MTEQTKLQIVGYTAGVLTTLAFVPQLVKTFRSRSAGDISWAWLLTFTTGVALWLMYGLGMGSWPVTLANLVTLVLVLGILALKVRFR